MNLKFGLLITAFTMSTSIIAGQDNKTVNPADNILPVVRCADFEVDGKGSDPEWDKSGWVGLTQYGSASPYETRFRIMYSDSGIYCLYDCSDNKINATLRSDNLDLWNEDVIEAFFWADERVPVYFEYELSPLNYELVLMVPNYNGRFLGWIPWHYDGNRRTRHEVFVEHDPGNQEVVRWTGEFFIPFELMKPMVQSTPDTGTRWRANFYRIDYDKVPGEWAWMPIVNNFHDFRLFGTIEFR
jgi:hypothetical protein